VNYPWYSQVAKSSDLQQGDFIRSMNVPRVVYSYNEAIKADKPHVEWVKSDWIILTQSCDLNPENNKVGEYIVVCPVATIDSYNLNRDNWGKIIRNKEYSYHCLKSTDHPISDGKYLVVNFKEAQYAKFDVVKKYANAKGKGKRLRLNSPYLENMAVRFGNTFARVAYPIDFPTKVDLDSYSSS
jgi:hypothetical protein